MSGYMIAEVWCEDCLERVQSEDIGSLRDHRADLREQGWRRVRRDGVLIDLCADCLVKQAKGALGDRGARIEMQT